MKYIINIIRIFFSCTFSVSTGKWESNAVAYIVWSDLVAALIFGRVYCGYVCPMNTLMFPVEWLSKKMKLQTSPKWLKKWVFHLDSLRR